ncbi:hypothetical protein NIES4072_00420 [Nostoc commune NIES-4072]|uniref:Uncharacterized protein n=1 Tax=Nostoc commune NIES-4072 TaxID=2005467 RepID=A0A2R5FDK6_NOSCO|nr:hypothetical protein [Nostoc commune]BBD66278.1 hypothetical protein NIES4070_26390 [Nostoc commune HK-02]GBG16396.1 hypothetical protein NIES4072_00420 [Nostoc commune NIES-4072]
MSIIIQSFPFYNRYVGVKHDVRIYSDEKGGNSKIVLEDVVLILLAQPRKPADTNEVIAITKEKIELASVTPTDFDGLHLATVDQMEEFYICCDELGDYGKPTVYERFGKWWVDILRELMEKRLAHIGRLVSRVPVWEKDLDKTRRIFGKEANKEIALRTWLEMYYKLSVDWMVTIIIYKTRNKISHLYRGTTGEVPNNINSSNENDRRGNNVYTPETLVLIAPEVENLLDNPKRLLEDAAENIKKSDKLEKERNQVKILRLEGKSDDEIIEQIWKVTPQSNLAEAEEEGEYKNYQYELLKVFVQFIKK